MFLTVLTGLERGTRRCPEVEDWFQMDGPSLLPKYLKLIFRSIKVIVSMNVDDKKQNS